MKKTYRYLIAIVLLIAVMFLNMQIIPSINRMRHDAGLTRNLPVDNAPPQFVLAVNILGSLRCLLIDMLWLRTMKLREDGKYFEMAQLYKWICQLEPQIEDIWTHNAWNMAYNISFEMPFAEDRWRWIRQAISLLRDEGLMYNTQSASIRKEIAWIYAHKIGQQWDDMHQYYKEQLALEMDPLIKGPDDIRVLAALPDFESALKSNPTLRAAWNTVKSANLKSYNDFSQWLSTIGSDVIDPETLSLLDSYMRANTLTNDYKLNLSRMVELQDKFGPIEWRLPESHALYWAYDGKEYAEERHQILYDRLIYLSLQSLYRRGALYLVEDGDDVLYITGPDVRFIEPMYTLYQELFDTYGDIPAMQNILSSYYYYLQEVVVLFYAFNDKEESEKYFKILKDKFPKKVKEDDYITFVLKQFQETAQTGNYDHVKSLIYSLVRQAYWNLALNQDEQYTGYLKLANAIRAEYLRSTGNQQRLTIPSIKEICQQVVDQALKHDFPASLQNNLKHRLENTPKSNEEKSVEK